MIKTLIRVEIEDNKYFTFSNLSHSKTKYSNETVYPRLMKAGVIEEEAPEEIRPQQEFNKSFSLENGDGLFDDLVPNWFNRKVEYWVHEEETGDEKLIALGRVNEVSYKRNSIEVKTYDANKIDNFEIRLKTYTKLDLTKQQLAGILHGQFWSSNLDDAQYIIDTYNKSITEKKVPIIFGQYYKVPIEIYEIEAPYPSGSQAFQQSPFYTVRFRLLNSDLHGSPLIYFKGKLKSDKWEHNYSSANYSKGIYAFDVPLLDLIAIIKNGFNELTASFEGKMKYPEQIIPELYRLAGKDKDKYLKMDTFDRSHRNYTLPPGVTDERLPTNEVAFYIKENIKYVDFLKKLRNNALVQFSIVTTVDNKQKFILEPMPSFKYTSEFTPKAKGPNVYYHGDLINGEIRLKRDNKHIRNDFKLNWGPVVGGDIFTGVTFANRQTPYTDERLKDETKVINLQSNDFGYNKLDTYLSYYVQRNAYPKGEFDIKVPVTTLDSIDHNMYDFIEVHTRNDLVDPPREQYGGILKGEIIGRKIDLDKLEYTLTLREVR